MVGNSRKRSVGFKEGCSPLLFLVKIQSRFALLDAAMP